MATIKSRKSNHPTIAVAGHLVLDNITFPDGATTIALGGISYSLAALLSIMSGGIALPVCVVGSDIKNLIKTTFGSFKVFDASGIDYTPLPNVINRLVYNSSGQRDEWSSRRPEPISLANIGTDIDALLVNFISGDDIAPDELKSFRNRFPGLIYCDYHSLALSHDENGRRHYRRHSGWAEYLSFVDFVQMNLAELSTIVGEISGNPREIASHCRILHGSGPDVVLITLGADGAVLSTESGKTVYHIPRVEILDEVDPTGCGDTLAAVFVYNYVMTRDIVGSAVLANHYAAAKATFSGLDGFRNIGAILKRIGPPTDPVRLDI